MNKEKKLRRNFNTLRKKAKDASFIIQHKQEDESLKKQSRKNYQRAVAKGAFAMTGTKWTLKSNLTEIYAQKALEEQSTRIQAAKSKEGRNLNWKTLTKKMISEPFKAEQAGYYKQKIENYMKTFVEHREILVNGFINTIAYCKGRLAIGTEFPNIVIYRVTKLALEVYQDNLLAHSGGVSALSFSHGGTLLFSGGRDLKIVIWRLGDDFKYSFLYLINIEAEGKSYPNKMVWKETEDVRRLFVTRYRQPNVLVYKKEKTKKKLEKFQVLKKEGFDTRVIDVTIDAQYVFIAGDSPDRLNIMVWEFDEVESLYVELYSLAGHDSCVMDIAVSEDGRSLLSGDFLGQIIIWKLSNQTFKFEQKQVIKTSEKDAIGSLDLSPNGELIIAGSHDKTVKIYKQDLDDEYQIMDDFKGHNDKIKNTMLTPDGNYVITCASQDVVKVRGLKNIRQKYIDFQEVDPLEINNKQDIWSMHMSRDLQTLITTSKAPDFIVWKYNTKKKKFLFWQQYEDKGASKKQSVPLSLSPDGKHIIFGVDDRVIFLKKTKQMIDKKGQKISKSSTIGNTAPKVKFRIVKQWSASKKSVTSLQFFSDNSLDFIMGDEMKSVNLWRFNAKDNEHKYGQLMIGHTKPISGLVISGDSMTLISGSDDKLLKVWTRTSRKKQFENLQTIKTKAKICTLKLANKDKMLLMGRKDKSIRVFLKNYDGKFTLVQEFKKAMKYIGNMFIMELFDGGRFLATLQKSGAPCKVWYVDDHCLKEIGEINKMTKKEKIEKSKNKKKGIKTGGKELEKVHRIAISSDFSRMIMVGGEKKTKIETVQLKANMTIKEDFECYKLLQELYSDRTRFISTEALDKLIDFFEGSNSDFIWLQKIHSGLNLVLLAVLSREAKLFKKTLDMFGYASYFFQEGFDPLDVAIELNNRQILRVVVDYFTLEANKNKFLSFLTFDRFCKAMRTSSEDFKQFVTGIYLEEPSRHNADFHLEYPISKKRYRMLKTNFRLYDENLRARIESLAAGEPRSSGTPCLVKHIIPRFELPRSIFDEMTYKQLTIIENLSDEMLVGDYQYILKFIWAKNYKKILCISMLHCLTYAVFVFEIVWDPSSQLMGFLSLAMSTFFLIYELMIAAKIKDNHSLSSLTTWLDIYTYLAPCLITGSNILGTLDLENLPTNIWVNTTILLAGFKTLGELRVLDSVRHMVAMLFQALVDMVGFVIILVCSIIFFSIAKISATRVSGEPLLELKEFFVTMDYYYNVANGNWDPSTGHNAMDYLLYLVSGIFLAVVLLNLVIAVISLTFENLEEIKELVDLREMTEILLSQSAFCSYFSRLGFVRRRFEKERSLYCMILKVDNRDSELKALIQDSTSEIIKKMESDKKVEKEAQDRLSDELGLLRGENKQLRDQVRKMVKMLEEQAKEIKETRAMLSEEHERSQFRRFNQDAAESELVGQEREKCVKSFSIKENKFRSSLFDLGRTSEMDVTGMEPPKHIKEESYVSSTSRKENRYGMFLEPSKQSSKDKNTQSRKNES